MAAAIVFYATQLLTSSFLFMCISCWQGLITVMHFPFFIYRIYIRGNEAFNVLLRIIAAAAAAADNGEAYNMLKFAITQHNSSLQDQWKNVGLGSETILTNWNYVRVGIICTWCRTKLTFHWHFISTNKHRCFCFQSFNNAFIFYWDSRHFLQNTITFMWYYTASFIHCWIRCIYRSFIQCWIRCIYRTEPYTRTLTFTTIPLTRINHRYLEY